MRLASYVVDGRATWGAVTGEGSGAGLIDLATRTGFADLATMFAAGGIAQAGELAARTSPDRALSSVRLLKPVPRPSKIICVGVNYAERNEEYRDNSDRPKWPSIFMRTPGSFVAHGEPILRPPESAQLDYEGEIAIVIGSAGRRIPRARALAHIGGLMPLNEGTIRDWLRHGKFNVTQGKNFDRTGSMGPWLQTPEGLDLANLRVRTRVNGEERQNDTTARLMFPFDYLIEYISTWTTLEPGDVIATGTPTGAGARFDPPKWLVPGDRLEVEVEGIGTLANPIADDVT